MAKYYTKRKSNKNKPKNRVELPPIPPKVQQELKHEISKATDKIKSWTRRQLGAYQNDRNPVCIPIKDGYKIGLYRLHVYPNKTCEVYDRNDELVHLFENKVNAVLYTIYTIKMNTEMSNEILTLDSEINRNYNDMLLMRRGIASAVKQKDFFAVDAKQARLDIVEKRLQLARNKMEKIHLIAKSAKIWQ